MTHAAAATLTPEKSAAISARILTLVAKGMSPIDALAAVIGRDKVDMLIDDLYHTLRGEQPDPFARLVALGLATPDLAHAEFAPVETCEATTDTVAARHGGAAAYAKARRDACAFYTEAN